MGTPSENVFLGDLPANIDEASLRQVFSAYGTVQSLKILPLSARGSGGAILSFSTVEEATWVVNNLNGNIPQGLSAPITVNFKTSAGKGAAFAAPMGGGKCGAGVGPSETLFVGDLPPSIDEATLLSVFGAYGTIVSHKILNPGTSGAAAIINLGTVEEAKWCVENLNGNIPQGLPTPVKVSYKQAPGQPGGWSGAGGKDGGGKDWGGGKGGGGKGGGWGCGGKSEGGTQPSNTLFLGDLPPTIDEATLLSVFGTYGTIMSHKILNPGTTGAAAIVTLGSLEEAKWCVENLHGNIPQGLPTPIKCRYKENKAQPAESWVGGGWGCGGKGGGGSEPSQTLFVGDLPPTIDEATLLSVFGTYGTIMSHKMLNPGTTGAAAIIMLSTVEEAKWCVENLDGNIPQGLPTPVKCRFKENKAPQSGCWGGGGKDCGGKGEDWGCGSKGGGKDWVGGGKNWGGGKGDDWGCGGKGGGDGWSRGGKDWGGSKGGGKDWGGGGKGGDDWGCGGKGGGNDWGGGGKACGGGKGDDWSSGGKGGAKSWSGGGKDWGNGTDGGGKGKGWAPY